MKNIHVLPTDKPSRLWMTKLGNLSRCHDTNPIKKELGNNMNIYITSDEQIKEGDWCIMTNDFGNIYLIRIISLKCIGGNEIRVLLSLNGRENTSLKDSCKKIILTTDQDLIKNGVQEIDDIFLEWFVENPTCEFVKIEPDYDEIRGDYYRIILKEEQPKEIIYYCKQETLEEAAIRLFNDFQKNNPIVPKNNINPYKLGFIDGIKWQQERMYSEEDMLNFYDWLETSVEINKFWRKNRIHPTMDGSHNEKAKEKRKELFNIWKEQFKNQTK
jgi:hypothetical protein